MLSRIKKLGIIKELIVSVVTFNNLRKLSLNLKIFSSISLLINKLKKLINKTWMKKNDATEERIISLAPNVKLESKLSKTK